MKHKTKSCLSLVLLSALLAAFFPLTIKPARAAVTLQRPTLVNLGLVGYWAFEGGDISGTAVIDHSGYGNNGTVSSPAPTMGYRGQALNMTSTSNTMSVGNPASLQINGDITMCAWVYSNGLATGQFILAKSNGTTRDYSLYRGSAGYLSIYSSGGSFSSSPYTVPAKQWSHTCITVKSGAVVFYIDNNVYDLGQTTTITDSGKTLSVGRDGNSGGFDWNGKIDEVRIYNRALSASEISRLYNSGTTKINSAKNNILTSGLKGLWSFNGSDISGTTAIDSSGQGNNGTLTGGPKPAIGKAGQALDFDCFDDFVSIPKMDLSAKSAMSISAWIKPRSISVNRYYEIVRQDETKTPNWLLAFQEWGTVLSFGLNTTGGYQELDVNISAANYTDGDWYLITATYDGQKKRLYRDGVEIGQQNQAGTIIYSSNAGHNIGRSPQLSLDGYEYFNGLIDEVRIYDRALTPTEISRLYN